jgi:hypothetical protein
VSPPFAPELVIPLDGDSSEPSSFSCGSTRCREHGGSTGPSLRRVVHPAQGRSTNIAAAPPPDGHLPVGGDPEASSAEATGFLWAWWRNGATLAPTRRVTTREGGRVGRRGSWSLRSMSPFVMAPAVITTQTTRPRLRVLPAWTWTPSSRHGRPRRSSPRPPRWALRLRFGGHIRCRAHSASASATVLSATSGVQRRRSSVLYPTRSAAGTAALPPADHVSSESTTAPFPRPVLLPRKRQRCRHHQPVPLGKRGPPRQHLRQPAVSFVIFWRWAVGVTGGRPA